MDVGELRAAFSYDPETGSITRLVGTSKREAGTSVPVPHGDGYLCVWLGRRQFFAHRVAWALGYGVAPVGYIDHINGDRADNRLANLRQTTKRGNAENLRKAYRNNRSGLLGVHSRAGRPGFRARIRVNGALLDLGAFENAADAHAAYLTAKRRLHAGCTL